MDSHSVYTKTVNTGKMTHEDRCWLGETIHRGYQYPARMPSTTPNPPTGLRKRIQPWPSDNLILSTNQQSMHAGRQTFSTAVRRDGQITSSHDVSSKGRRDIIIDHYNENQNTSHYSCYIQGHWPWPSGQLWPSGQYYQHKNKTPKQPIKTPTYPVTITATRKLRT